MSEYQDHINMALAYHLSQRFEEAVHEFEGAAALGALEPEARGKLAQCYLALGQTAKAFPLVKSQLLLDPESAGLLNQVGDLAYQLEHFAEAADYFRRSLKLQGGQGETAFKLAYLCEREGNLSEAAAYYRSALEANPKRTAVANLLGAVYGRMSDFENAADAYRLALRVNPKDAAALAGLSAALEKMGDSKGAQGIAERFVEGNPGNLEGMRGLAWSAARSGEAGKAKDYFKRILEADAQDRERHQIRAWLFLQEGQSDKAAEEYRAGLREEPNNQPLLEGLSALLYKRGDYAGALSALTTLVALNSAHVEALSRLGSLYLRLGRKEEALKAWEQGLQADPANVILKNNLKVLKG